MGGGPSKQQTDAATAQANLSNQLGQTFGRQEQFSEAQQNKVNPFYTQRMEGGLPYFNAMTDATSGTTAQGFAPARAQLERTLGQNANALPSGFATGARTDLASQQGRAFDQTLQGALGANEMSKQQGASGLLGQAQIANPTAYASGALQGNQSIMGAPLAKPGLGGLLGGLAGGLASAIPFVFLLAILHPVLYNWWHENMQTLPQRTSARRILQTQNDGRWLSEFLQRMHAHSDWQSSSEKSREDSFL